MKLLHGSSFAIIEGDSAIVPWSLSSIVDDVKTILSTFVAWDFVLVGRDVYILAYSVAFSFLAYVLFTDRLVAISSQSSSVSDQAERDGLGLSGGFVK